MARHDDPDAQARRALVRALVDHRKAAHISQRQVAETMVPSTTQSAVSKLESGGHEPQLATLQRYARAVGLRLTITVGMSLQDLYAALPAHLAETEPPLDVEAGLARLHQWIDEQERDHPEPAGKETP